MIQAERAAAKDGGFLLLDAGDSLVGDREPAMRSKGATSIDLLNRLGYDAMVLGPADLSLGPALVRQRIAEAKFAVLAADVTDAATKEPVAAPYVLREVGGRRVALVGLSGAPSMNGFAVADGPGDGAESVAADRRPVRRRHPALPRAARRERTHRGRNPRRHRHHRGGRGIRAEPWVSKVTGTPIYHADAPSSGHAGRVMGVGN